MPQATQPRRLTRCVMPSIFVALAMAGCASLRSAEAPGCSGARRPANPHGSVLVTDPAPPAPTGGAGLCAGGRP